MNSPEIPAVYNDTAVRQFSLMAVVWGVVGMLVGVIIAAQLTWPELNFGIPWLSYGRLRPLHTNAVIFAFGGCALIGTSYFVVQRTCQTSLFMPKLAAFTFWGWQLVILAADVSLPLGYTNGKVFSLDIEDNVTLEMEGFQHAADIGVTPDGKTLLIPDMKAGTVTWRHLH